jgi:hypothetical protein
MNQFGAGMMAGSWIWSMIDAPISAHGINQQAKRTQSAAHMIEFKNGDNVLGIDVAPKRQGFAAQMSYSFK